MGRRTAENAEETAAAQSADVMLDSVLRKAARVATDPERDALIPMLPRIGQIVGEKYRIEERLGRGGMGAVFRATHVVSQKPVALKWMLRSTADDAARRRFVREALAAGRIDHPNVVDVYDIGEEGPCAYLVMERLYGETLRARLARGPMRPAEAAAVLLPAMRGVAAAHQVGVIHRDLKPDNIFLCAGPDGAPREPKVLDFGVASVLDTRLVDPTLTNAGSVLGTPAYMCPEQLRNARDIDVRADVYAFGVILYEALTGRRPFEADSYLSLAVAIVQQAPIPPSQLCAGLSRELEAIVLRALAKEREQRFQSIQQLMAALSPYIGVRDDCLTTQQHTPAQQLPGVVLTEPTESSMPQARARTDAQAPAPELSGLSAWGWIGAASLVGASTWLASALWFVPTPGEPLVTATHPLVTQQLTGEPGPYLLPVHEPIAKQQLGAGVIARSCEEARRTGTSSDQLVTIDPDGAGPVKAFEVFCVGMSAGPAREYLPLKHNELDHNVTRFVYDGRSCPCPDLTRRFTRVRLDPRTLSVDPGDDSFAAYDRPLSCEQEHRSQCGESAKLIWGGAGSCRGAGDTSGQASIDLRGTPFALAPEVRFVPAGFGASGSSTISSDRKTVTLVGGGRCGSVVAEAGNIALVALP